MKQPRWGKEGTEHVGGSCSTKCGRKTDDRSQLRPRRYLFAVLAFFLEDFSLGASSLEVSLAVSLGVSLIVSWGASLGASSLSSSGSTSSSLSSTFSSSSGALRLLPRRALFLDPTAGAFFSLGALVVDSPFLLAAFFPLLALDFSFLSLFSA